MSGYSYQNLVFRGGGILGIAYLGALKVLDSPQYNILSQIKRVSGASAGAITALVTSFSESADEIRQIANSLDFTKVPEKDDKQRTLVGTGIHKLLGVEEDDVECVNRLVKKYGWYSSDFFYTWLKSVIQAKFQSNASVNSAVQQKQGLQTFADFKAAGYRDLYISVTNITKRRNEIFSNETHPEMPVADAVRMSMSIPLYFNSVVYNGDHYADGGTVNNYPMEIFDDAKYVSDPAHFVDGINWETLGCHLFTPADTPHKAKSDSLIHYIEDLFITLLAVQNITFSDTPNIEKRSANISDLGISAVDFSIVADNGDPLRTPTPDTPYDNLYRSGYQGMQAFLQAQSTQ